MSFAVEDFVAIARGECLLGGRNDGTNPMIRAAADLMYRPSPRGLLGTGDLTNAFEGRGELAAGVEDMVRVGVARAELESEAR